MRVMRRLNLGVVLATGLAAPAQAFGPYPYEEWRFTAGIPAHADGAHLP